MELLNLSALWLLPLVAVLFFLSRRRLDLPRRAVANLYLWRQTSPTEPLHLAVHRLRPDWLLVARVAFMLALIAALAHPVLFWRPRHVTLVFDISASMGARDSGVSRLDVARQRAQSVLDGLPRIARVRLVAARAVPEDAGEFSAGGVALERALAELRPSAGSAELAGAVRLARTLDPGTEIVVLSDTTPPTEAEFHDVRWMQVGRPLNNVAITALAARRSISDPRHGQVLVELFNHSSASRDITIELAGSGTVVSRDVVHVGAHVSRTLLRDIRDLDDVVTARIAPDDDALTIDNERSAIARPLRPIRVGLIKGGSYFLEQALSANPAFAVEVTTSAVEGRKIHYDVVVCDGCRSTPPGDEPVLLIPPTAAGGGLPAPLRINLPSHPIARALDGWSVSIAALSPADPLANPDVIFRAGSTPVVTARDEADRRIVVFNLDSNQSELPLNPAFPILVSNGIEWLSGRNDMHADVVAGEPLRWVLPRSESLSPLTVAASSGQPMAFTLSDRHLTVTRTDAPGVYVVSGRGFEERFVVNAATEVESNLLTTPTAAEASVAGSAGADRRVGSDLRVLLLVAALVLFAGQWWLSAARGGPSNLAWRGAIGAMLALSAWGIRVPTRDGHATVIFAIDRSDSMGPGSARQAVARVNAMMAAMGDRDRAGIVVFGTDAALERRPTSRAAVVDIASQVPMTGTNIEAALRLARTALPADGLRRIVLMSDGQQTTGDATREGALAATNGIRIDIAPLGSRERVPPVAIRGVSAPGAVRVGEPFSVAVEIEGPPGAHARVAIYPDAERRIDRDLVLPPEGFANLAVTETPQRSGVFAYRAAILNEGGEPDDAFVGTTVTVSGEAHMLYVTGGLPQLSAVLGTSGFRVNRVAPPAIPSSAPALARYDVVVLDDVPSETLTSSQTSALAQYVEDTGGGLLLLGSARSLGSAGYPIGPLGRLLPVDLRPRTGRRAPPVAFVLVFDKSGSMADRAGGVQKIELARQAVMRVLDVMPATDSLGFIAFDANPLVVAPLGPAQDARAIASRLRAIEAGGPTAIAPAMDLALGWLRRAPVERRRILLVTDGRTSPADAERVRAAVSGGDVELSIAAIGPDADRELIRRLAAETGGRAYFPDDLLQLPVIAARDAARSAGGSVVEEPFTVQAASHPVLTGIGRATLPALGGYVVSAARPGADAVLTSHLDDPILAAWRFGLGRIGVFTADLGSEWSDGMRDWSDFASFWAQATRWLSQRSASRLVQVGVDVTTDAARLVVEAERPDGGFVHLRDAHAAIRTPSGDFLDIPLRPIAPGRYEADVVADEMGKYEVAIDARDADTGADVRALTGFYWSADRERIGRGLDLTGLTRLAQMTGGQVLADAASPFSDPRPTEYRDVSSLVALAALFMFVIDVAIRRGIRASVVRRWWRSRATAAIPHEAAG